MKAASVANVPAPVSQKSPLWKWTSISAAGHAVFLALLCLISSQLEKQKQAKIKADAEQKAAVAAAAEKAAAEKAAADKAAAEKKKASTPETPKAASAGPASATGTTNDVKTAEKILGIDKVASPDELKKGLKSKDDDLLKDLK